MAPNLTSATLLTPLEMIFLHTMMPSLSLLLCCLLSWVQECVGCDSKEQKVVAIVCTRLGPDEDWPRRKLLCKPNNNQIKENQVLYPIQYNNQLKDGLGILSPSSGQFQCHLDCMHLTQLTIVRRGKVGTAAFQLHRWAHKQANMDAAKDN